MYMCVYIYIYTYVYLSLSLSIYIYIYNVAVDFMYGFYCNLNNLRFSRSHNFDGRSAAHVASSSVSSVCVEM